MRHHGWHNRRHDEAGGGRGRFGRGRDRGLARLFDHGDLRFVILKLIADKPRHGYEIIKAIEERAAGAYSPSPGVVYPTLTMLDELGYVTVSTSDGKKKLYEITDEGAKFLKANRASVDVIFARIDEVHAAHGGGPDPQIVRASENLKLALRLRLGRGPLTQDQRNTITAALDAAAVAIERS